MQSSFFNRLFGFTRHCSVALLAVGGFAVVLLLAGLVHAAPTTPSGPPFQVSPADGRDHLAPAAGVDARGVSVVAWQGFNAETNSIDIFARRYGPDGAPLGATFRVNVNTASSQRRPAVAVAADGAFVIAWDSSTSRVWARRFDAEGAPRGGDIAVNQSSGGSHFDPSLGIDSAGGFVVAWQFTGAPLGDGNGVAYRRFDATGTALSSNLLPYDGTSDSATQANPAVTVSFAGSYALAWEELSTGAQGDNSTIVLRSYSNTGAALSDPQPVAVSTSDELRDPAVAFDPSNTLTLAWAALPSGGVDSLIYTRRYGVAGVALNAASLASSAGLAERFGPVVAAGGDGDTVIVWGDATTVQGGGLVGVVGRRLGSTGLPAGEEFYPTLPAAYEASSINGLAAAAGAGQNSSLVIAWANDEAQAGQLPVSSVYARRYAPPYVAPTATPTMPPTTPTTATPGPTDKQYKGYLPFIGR